MRPASLSPALEHAIAYVLDNPGKQLRARLTQASYLLLSDTHDVERVHSAATAIEWLHCYSLIHDDLPAMDNDDLRRGQATLHKAFDEATAILVGDGLQASAFELIASDDHLSHKMRTEVMTVIAQAVGFMGMVGGQALDMEAENKPSTITMHCALFMPAKLAHCSAPPSGQVRSVLAPLMRTGSSSTSLPERSGSRSKSWMTC